MGRQHDAVLNGERVKIVERCEDLDIGVQVRDRTGLGKKPLQHPRLHRGCQLEHAVDSGHSPQFVTGNPDLRRVQNPERLGSLVDFSLKVVEHAHGKHAARVVFRERARKDAGLREVVAGNDRASVHARRRGTVEVFSGMFRPGVLNARSLMG